MKKSILSLSVLALLGFGASASAADLPSSAPAPAPVVGGGDLSGGKIPPVVVQIGPTTTYSTINCAEFTKLPDGTWQATAKEPFGLGFVQGIVPPSRPIKIGSYIYNNIDLFSQLEEQCTASLVRARY